MYPRAAAPLLPGVLAPILGGEPLPRSLTATLGLPCGLCLGGLDEGVWVEYSRDVIGVLAGHVLRCVTRRWGEIAQLQSSVSFAGASVEELELSMRSRNCLLRNDWHRREKLPGRALRDITVCELTRIHGFGPRSLLDVLSAASAASPPTPARVRELTLAARCLAGAPWSRLVSREDPRLGGMVRAVDQDARTAREAAQRAGSQDRALEEQWLLLLAINSLLAEANRLRGLGLEQELRDILAATLDSDSARLLVSARLGLAGEAPVTLERAGRATGVSHERVRQIEQSFREAIAPALNAGGVWTPALDRTLQIIRHTKLATSPRLGADLASRGLIPDGFSTSSILAAARVFAKPFEVYAEHGLIYTHPLPATPAQIAKPAGWLVRHWGATTIETVRARLHAETGLQAPAQLTTLLLETHKGFRWLDQRRGWFWIRATAQNRVLNQVQKILSVTPSLTTRELRHGIARHHRMKGVRLPHHILAALCKDSGRYELDGERVLARPGHPRWQDLLGANEATLVEVLSEHGPVMTRAALEQIAVHDRHLNRHSFTMYLSCSPVLDRPADGVYRLRGS